VRKRKESTAHFTYEKKHSPAREKEGPRRRKWKKKKNDKKRPNSNEGDEQRLHGTEKEPLKQKKEKAKEPLSPQ